MTTKLLIIGGVAGGATAAARARRLDEHAEITLFERGEYISFANCGLPYYIGQVIEDRNNLFVTTPQEFRDRYNIDIRIFAEVTTIDRKRKQVAVQDLKSGKRYHESYDKIILSPGAEPVRLPFCEPGIDGVFSLRTVADSDRIKAYVDTRRAQSAVVVGGGYIGLEMAENLVHRGVTTSIVEMFDQVMPPLDYEMAAIVHAHLKEKGVICELEHRVQSLSRKDKVIIVLTDRGKEIECDLVVVSAGIRPENRLAREAGLEIGDQGGIKVDPTMRTSDPNIYAVGDAVEVRDFVTGQPTVTALAGPANKQGRIAADNALGRRSVFKGTLGTTVVKVFDLTVAATGATEKALNQQKIPYLVSYTHSGSHASYYPGATIMTIKLLFSPSSGKILGGQIVGMDGVDKRIDVLATAIRGAMTVYDLEELELAYAPPYSSAKDPINVAGFVAANLLKGDLDTINWIDVATLDRKKDVLLDLRNKDELEVSGAIEGALHIPLNQLRAELPRLDKKKNYIPFCAVGMRSYVGHRILVQNGFTSKSLSGGFKTYLGAREKIMKEPPETRLWLSE
jgi:NADPH-dependent 2,4-dienoyl-CoA reductase/sulfur reductase-like enzyme/rhodanese-related sulfurtransferase